MLRFLGENIGEKTKRVVIFRRGDTYPNEIQIMQSSIKKSEFWHNFDINFVSVKDGIRRLYLKNEDGDLENPPSGIFIVLNENESSITGYSDQFFIEAILSLKNLIRSSLSF